MKSNSEEQCKKVFGQRLTARLAALETTAYRMSKDLGGIPNESQISLYKRGLYVPKPYTLARIAKYLDVTVDFLIGADDE